MNQNDKSSILYKGEVEGPLLLLADIHLTDAYKDNYRWGLFDWLENKQKKYHFTKVVILGDLTEKKNNHSALFVNKFVEALLYSQLSFIILMGNHDYEADQDPFFRFLRFFPTIHYIKQPAEYKWITNEKGKYKNLLFLPHTRMPIDDWSGINLNLPDYIFMHQTVTGSIASNGQKLIGELDDSLPVGEHTKVYSGDIHVPQRVGPIEYVGSPYHVHFGDNFSPRALLIYPDGDRIVLHFQTLQRFVATVSDPEEIRKLNCRENDQIEVRIRLHQREIGKWAALKRLTSEICIERKLDIRAIKPDIIQGKRRVLLKELHTPQQLKRAPDSSFRSYCKAKTLGDDILKAGLEIIHDH